MDEVAAPPLEQVREELAHRPDVGVEVDVEDAIPLLHRDHVRRTAHADAGVGVDEIAVSLPVDGLVDEGFYSRSLGDVGVHVHRLTSEVFDLGGDLFPLVVVDIRHHDVGALTREGEGRRAADARRTAGDDGDRAVEVERQG